MATPVSTEAPLNGLVRSGSDQERDLQAKMQHMIRLQYAEQTISNTNANANQDLAGGDGTKGHQTGAPLENDREDDGSRGGRGLTMTKRGKTKTHANLENLGNDTDTNSVDNNAEVGKGTIVFSGSLRGSMLPPGIVDDRLDQNATATKGLEREHQRYQMPSHSTTLESQQQRLLSSAPPQQIYSGYGSVHEQNHEFHYGNPDYNNIDDEDYYFDEHGGFRRDGDHRTTYCGQLFGCLVSPIANLVGQENLRRSFCYGAIDGLLTGSGIASALWGLGLLSVRTKTELRVAFVVVTLAACTADALCMAMGHVWTTYIVTSNHAWERSHERRLLEHDKADSKGRLVDMLLERGMLKIDAMSLADTLEGYPDLFVSALVGDSLLSSGIQDALLDERTDDGRNYPREHYSPGTYSDPATDFDGGGAFFGSFGSWKFPMHYDSDERGEFRNIEDRHARVVYSESQKEATFMMVGFAFFALIPSLLWLFLPRWFNNPANNGDFGQTHAYSSLSSQEAYSGVGDGETVNVPSLIILILSSIIWCLGVWKSSFVDSNWVVFGLETVAVLILCISSAYWIAVLLVHFLGLEYLILSGETSLGSPDL
ncbi:unnamed protein product [Pseudo-nitzschia multistriata]|uniref:Uncharacterized protein n=1 Tax=Pseudo-nitzschia multistriata TaxID=183589 RepID=A0A448YW67_9STRA|nr:unnamed protein product [Pseudo-nitzschia multistriata]